MAQPNELSVIYDWNDDSASSVRLAKRVAALDIGTNITHIRPGAYVSMDDEVTYDDLVQALDAAWKWEKLPNGRRSVDAVVHSTGRLVIRHWMTGFKTPETSPICRLLMLAPASFCPSSKRTRPRRKRT